VWKVGTKSIEAKSALYRIQRREEKKREKSGNLPSTEVELVQVIESVVDSN